MLFICSPRVPSTGWTQENGCLERLINHITSKPNCHPGWCQRPHEEKGRGRWRTSEHSSETWRRFLKRQKTTCSTSVLRTMKKWIWTSHHQVLTMGRAWYKKEILNIILLSMGYWLVNPERYRCSADKHLHAYFISTRNISKEKELIWDYGETRGSKLVSHPWLNN